MVSSTGSEEQYGAGNVQYTHRTEFSEQYGSAHIGEKYQADGGGVALGWRW